MWSKHQSLYQMHHLWCQTPLYRVWCHVTQARMEWLNLLYQQLFPIFDENRSPMRMARSVQEAPRPLRRACCGASCGIVHPVTRHPAAGREPPRTRLGVRGRAPSSRGLSREPGGGGHGNPARIRKPSVAVADPLRQVVFDGILDDGNHADGPTGVWRRDPRPVNPPVTTSCFCPLDGANGTLRRMRPRCTVRPVAVIRNDDPRALDYSESGGRRWRP